MSAARYILEKFNQLKTLPHVGIRISQLIADEKASVHDLEEVIRLDPTLVLRLLRLVNSPYFGLRDKVHSIAEAVVFIGFEHLRNLVVIEALKQVFVRGSESDSFARNKLWLHCAVTSICCRMVAERVFVIKGEDAFLSGLLHDIGMIVADQIYPERYQEICSAL